MGTKDKDRVGSRLDEDHFAYRTTQDGQVFIDWDGRQVTFLRGDTARKFLRAMASKDGAEAQRVMAKVTGNFKRGNERQAAQTREGNGRAGGSSEAVVGSIRTAWGGSLLSGSGENPSDECLRRAKAGDFEAIAEVLLRSRRDALPGLREVHTEEETRGWVAAVLAVECDVWVAEQDDRIVGFMALQGQMLEQLYVLPEYQGQGVGDRLLAQARRLSPEGLRLYTFQRNVRARSFYEKRGFGVVSFSDGERNEELEPDVLYEWRRR